jgi:hypothetical protein
LLYSHVHRVVHDRFRPTVQLPRQSGVTCEESATSCPHSIEVSLKELIEKMVANQGWDGDRIQHRTSGVHQVDGMDMLAAKMDLVTP